MESIVTLAATSIAATGSVVAAWVATRVHRQTKPIGNGFAHGVVKRLDRIETLITEHINAHATSDVRKRR
jgi:hypothetical protein